eukprot:TRINITY_DN67423_c0_g1_i1.p1 TRINITY_DN67423_c0_g1~~TRINITY_DN67423_c0_g1_i1.p1  ORF type:complete len:154 (+),score=13.08 TRINITY_DN67423_c0_g1_i1:60-521(+)
MQKVRKTLQGTLYTEARILFQTRNFGRSHWRVDAKGAHEELPADLSACVNGKDYIKWAKKQRLKVDTKSGGAVVVTGPPPERITKSIQQNSHTVDDKERKNILNAFYLMNVLSDDRPRWCTLRNTWCQDESCYEMCKCVPLESLGFRTKDKSS